MLEGTLGGLGNSTIQAKNLMQQHGKTGLYIGSHSRGTLTIANALRELDTQANQDQAILSNTNMKMVGAAANVAKADNRLNRLQGLGDKRTSNEQSIRIEGHETNLNDNTEVPRGCLAYSFLLFALDLA